MATIAEKLKIILDEKEKIKESLYLKGVDNVSNDWTQYADDIASIANIYYGDVDGIKYGHSEIESFPTGFRLAPRTGKNCEDLFLDCKYLSIIPRIDTSSCTSFCRMFKNCSNLQNLPLMDVSKGEDFTDMFSGCTSLLFAEGFVGLSYDLDLSYCPKLTLGSIIKIIDNLATVTTSPTLTLGETNLAKISNEEKQIALNKGWNLK